MIGRRGLIILVALLAAAPLAMSGIASAQAASPTATPTPKPASNSVSSNYYSNAGGFPDGTVRLVNTSGSFLCANIYVTDKDQEMKECCSCPVSNSGTRIISVNTDLTSNPVNGVGTSDGSISVVSSLAGTGGTCVSAASEKAASQLAAWATHPDASGLLTEDEFALAPAPTSAAISGFEKGCAAIALIGSGTGVCTCGSGG